jgi:hypothetical protein
VYLDCISWRFLLRFVVLLIVSVPCFGQDTASTTVDYLTQVKPLLRERCFACHGALQQKAGLRLDTLAAIVKGGESGSSLTPGDPANSSLLARVAAQDPTERMPPEHEGEPLTAPQIAIMRQWIEAGAKAPADEKPEADPREHWAFRPVVRPAVPAVKNSQWVRNPIDAFVARQHETQQLSPQPEATRLKLLRRLSIDLIGLPPSPEEIEACLNDTSPDWYAQTVKRLLDDPRHGERWARHWMDVWRYSDWWGLGEQLRNSQKHIWHWRDWMVESLNADLPYDEMVRRMLAADELYPNDLEKLRATGYLARNYFLFNRNQWMDETVEHVSKGFLGLTMNCSKCHAHKYDPIDQVDFYRMRAFFEPYHVRLDIVPDESDLHRDGLPVAFDGLPESPTYLFVRGQEKDPDKSVVITPGVPPILEFEKLKIEPVSLPAEAWQPERREWVGKAHLRAADAKVEAARAKVAPAREKLAKAEKHEADMLAKSKEKPAEPTSTMSEVPGLIEKFEALDTTRWKLSGGDWSHSPGKLEQKKDGPQRAVLRLIDKAPRDFEATLRFTTLSGSMWRSVGISYDCTQVDPAAQPGPDDHEMFAYVSAYAGGSKVQAALLRAGQYSYPGEAAAARPIELNKEYTLKLQVRDTLVNVALNGEPVIAWRSPMERREGAFQVTTFDALAVLHEITLAPLKPDVVLREGNASAPNLETPEGAAQAAAEAKLELAVAEMSVYASEAEVRSLIAKVAALASGRGEQDAELNPELARKAAAAEHEAGIAAAKLALAEAELKLLKAAADKRDEATKAVTAAREALDKQQQPAEPTEKFTRFSGAAWTPTRFFDSTKDDPAVTFPNTSTGRRKALAQWITDKRNPLTARVAINHIWNRHMGAPLVPTVFDFGRKGAEPSNPELLDWLAAELVDSGWSMKHIHRLIVESATYRMSAAIDETSLAKDGENRSLWRKSPTRLESQVVRDALLSLGGTLDETRGGPSVPIAQQADSKRRSLYFFHSNNERNLFLTMFDEALVKECYRREQSIVPQQALALTNSQLVLDSARPIAERLAKLCSDDTSFTKLAFRVILAAEPNAEELASSLQSLESWRQLPEAGTTDAATAFARTNLVWVLLNHNDFVMLQ